MKHLLVTACCVAALLGGCATSTSEGTASSAPVGEGPVQAVAQWAAALQSENVDAVMAHFSDQYAHPAYGDKSGARATVEQARVMGYLRGIEADTSAMKCGRDGAGCVAGPVKLTGSFGEYTLNLRLAEEAGAWKIIGSEELPAAQMAQVTK